MSKTSSIDLRQFWLARIFPLLLFAVVGVSGSGFAQQYEVRRFDPDRLEKFRNNPRFQYRRDAPLAPKAEVKERRTQRLPRWRPRPVSPSSGALNGIGKVIIWVLIIAGATLLIVQILRVRFGKLAKKKSDEAEVVYAGELDAAEDIRDLEFESLLEKAIREKRFRYAVRLLYLQSLRELHERGLIQWSLEKTNHQYLRELQSGPLRPIFQDVTRLFEYIWYGEFPVDKDHFHAARGSFIRLEQALRKDHAE
ncbi:MAG: DUF4129 domain-containing protein [Bacteroidota bacterium]